MQVYFQAYKNYSKLIKDLLIRSKNVKINKQKQQRENIMALNMAIISRI